MTTPASIRYNNPGAQYPGPSARKYGMTGTEIIGGGHQIAVFPDPVSGAAAQFDLLNRGYTGMSLQDAIRKWSGGNSSGAYAQKISEATGIPLNGVLTRDLLSDPKVAIGLAKTAADWEAGGRYPMTDQQWQEAFAKANGGTVPPTQSTGEKAVFPQLLATLMGSAGPTAAAAGTATAGPQLASLGAGSSVDDFVNSLFKQPQAAGGQEGQSSPFGNLFKLGSGKPPEMPDAQAPNPLGDMQAAQPQRPDFNRLRQVIAQRPTLGFSRGMA